MLNILKFQKFFVLEVFTSEFNSFVSSNLMANIVKPRRTFAHTLHSHNLPEFASRWILQNTSVTVVDIYDSTWSVIGTVDYCYSCYIKDSWHSHHNSCHVAVLSTSLS